MAAVCETASKAIRCQNASNAATNYDRLSGIKSVACCRDCDTVKIFWEQTKTSKFYPKLRQKLFPKFGFTVEVICKTSHEVKLVNIFT